MMQDDDNLPDRDAWRRVLQRGAGEPPRATDERIRARARRALAPHSGRWWLPASLAASLLLAVLVVQWQYEDIRSPALVTESDVAPAPDRPTIPAAPPAAGDAATAAVAERESGKRAEPAGVAVPAQQAEATPAAGTRQSAEVQARAVSADESPTPEQWYARIEELRAAGREEEAQAELQRLEQAFPGWLERRLREQKE